MMVATAYIILELTNAFIAMFHQLSLLCMLIIGHIAPKQQQQQHKKHIFLSVICASVAPNNNSHESFLGKSELYIYCIKGNNTYYIAKYRLHGVHRTYFAFGLILFTISKKIKIEIISIIVNYGVFMIEFFFFAI